VNLLDYYYFICIPEQYYISLYVLSVYMYMEIGVKSYICMMKFMATDACLFATSAGNAGM